MVHQYGDFDLLVIGGGIAGTSAALVAGQLGLAVCWVREPPRPDVQSLHWHGYLHRGHLYDPRDERNLILRLRESARYWDDPDLAAFVHDTPSLIVAPGPSGGRAPDPRLAWVLRPGVRAVRSDERVLDGPRYLAAAWAAADELAVQVQGTCTDLHDSPGSTSVTARITGPGGEVELSARKAVVATGIDPHRLAPPGVVEQRMSRMLVIRGDLPRVALIAPGPALGGLFIVPRPLPGGACAWLVSDAYSSAMGRSGLLNGWWVCSVADRLTEVFDAALFEDATVRAYAAPKSSLKARARRVNDESHEIRTGGKVAVFVPSKWTLAPHAAVGLVADLFPATGLLTGGGRTRLVRRIADHDDPHRPRPTELWEVSPPDVPLRQLLTQATGTLQRASALFSA